MSVILMGIARRTGPNTFSRVAFALSVLSVLDPRSARRYGAQQAAGF